MNLIAGKKAKASAAYEPAFNYLQVGIRLLGEKGWQTQYDLALALHVEAAEAAYLTGDFEQMERLAQIVRNQAKTVLDKAQVIEVKILALIAQTKLEQAVDTGVQILRELGVRLPQKPNKLNILMGLLETKLTLAGKRISDLAELRQMSDPFKLAALRILSRIVSPAFIAAPKLLPLIASKQVILSVKHGNCAESIYAYAIYGLILCGVVGDIESGYEFGQLALRLLERFNARKFKTKALFIANGFIGHWKAPAKETLLPLLEAYKSGLETGDLEYAAYAVLVYSFNAYLSGKELSELESQMAAYSKVMGQLNQEPALSMHQPHHQAVLNLLYRAENPCFLIGNAYDELAVLPSLIQANARTSIFYVYLNKLILCYLFGQYSEALSNAGFSEQYLDGATATFTVPPFYFYDSLAQLSLYHNVQKFEQKRCLNKVIANQKKMKKWAHYAPMNHLHKFYLVEAERYRVIGKNVLAMEYYDKAIALSKEHEYINETALAYELAAKFYLSKGKELTARAYMQEARYCYQLWGATAKVKDLEKRYPQWLAATSQGSQGTKTNTVVTTTGSGSSLDIATVMKASQAISGEIVLDKLLASLMKILLENVGAQRGYLILENQRKLLIEAESAIDSERVTVLQSIPLENSQVISEAIVNYVARTFESVVLSDATAEGNFTKDSYIQQHQPKSILCFPLINQGKLVSIVYLENNLTTGAFTPERFEVLKILSAQATISIENARLYQTLEDKVKERTAQLAEANQEITALNKRLKAENSRMSAELEVTKQLQQMILPKQSELESIEGLEIAGYMEPADEVGGDYYDVLQQDGKVKISIGDVTGHGLESGVLMLMTQTAVRTLFESKQTDSVRFLDILNRTIYGNVQRINPYKNLTLCVLDYANGSLSLSGQHEELIVVRSGGKIELIDTINLGFPIGLEEDIAEFIFQEEIQLNSGDVVVLYTDGITEAFDINREEYGLEKLCEVVSHNWEQSAQGIRQAVIEDVRRHIGSQKVFDDITLVVLKQK